MVAALGHKLNDRRRRTAGGAAAGLPVNTVAPVASGTVRIGNVLSVTTGTWTNSPTGYAYQWKRDGVNIASATASTYTVVQADIGPLITCDVTASNGAGAGIPAASNGLRYNLATARFGAGEVGYWLDPQNAASVFTNMAGTMEAAVNDQPARIDDLSGNAVVFEQSSTTARPFLRQDGSGRRYLQFDGGNDGMSTASTVDFTGDQLTVVVAIRKVSDAAQAIVLESSSAGGTTNGTFGIRAPGTTPGTNRFTAISRGTTVRVINSTEASDVAPITAVVTNLAEISPSSVELRVNGVSRGVSTDPQGSGDYTSQTQFLGSRNNSSDFFNGWIYQVVVCNAATTGNDLIELEQWCAYRSGVTL